MLAVLKCIYNGTYPYLPHKNCKQNSPINVERENEEFREKKIKLSNAPT